LHRPAFRLASRDDRFPRHNITIADSPNGRSEAGFGRDKFTR
jgi:hypothetical protein